MKAWSFEYPEPLMPNREVCLRTFSIPDSENQAETCAGGPDGGRSSWTECMLFDCWTETHSVSNLNILAAGDSETTGKLLCNCKLFLRIVGEIDAELLVCDNSTEPPMITSPLLFAHLLAGELVSQCLCSQLSMNSAEVQSTGFRSAKEEL